jgi:hypothetical protein
MAAVLAPVLVVLSDPQAERARTPVSARQAIEPCRRSFTSGSLRGIVDPAELGTGQVLSVRDATLGSPGSAIPGRR